MSERITEAELRAYEEGHRRDERARAGAPEFMLSIHDIQSENARLLPEVRRLRALIAGLESAGDYADLDTYGNQA